MVRVLACRAIIQNALLQCNAVACRQQDGGGPANSRPLVVVPPPSL